MVNELSQNIAPEVGAYWTQLQTIMRTYFSQVEKANCSNVNDICELLLDKNIISFGKYDVLVDAFNEIDHQICVQIIQQYTREIAKLTKDENVPASSSRARSNDRGIYEIYIYK